MILYLFLVLAAIYLLECVMLVGRYSVVFSRGLLKNGSGYSFLERGPLFLNMHVWFCGPVPFVRETFACSPLPFSVSPEGVAGDAGIFMFDDMKSIRVREKAVYINDILFVSTGFPRYARILAGDLGKIATMPKAERHGAVSQLIRVTFDRKKAIKTYGEFRGHVKYLKIFSAVLFLFLFVMLPVSAFLGGFENNWLRIVLILVLLMAGILFSYFIASSRLLPDCKTDKWQNIFSMLFSPPLAIRAVDFISKNLFAGYDPLVAGELLLPAGRYDEFRDRTIRKMRFRKKAGDPHIAGIEDWYYDELFAAAGEAFGARYVQSCLEPPQRENPEILAYCPRCRCGYRHDHGLCSECGIDLVKY